MKHYTQPVQLEELVPLDIRSLVKEVSFSADREGWREQMDKECEIIREGEERLYAIDVLARKTDSILFRALRIPRGDGYARYQVTKVGARSCHVKHIALGDDDWHSPEFGDGGSFPLSFVKRMLKAYGA